jgi:hypothetical protein
MKMFLLSLTTIALFLLMVQEWRSYSNAIITEISVLRDSTDSLLSEVSADAIFRQYRLFDDENDNQWNGSRFRYQTINEVSYNKVTEAILFPESFWLGNNLDRDKKIEKFRNEVFKPFKDQGKSRSKSHSSVYLPIARELRHISESNSTIKKVFIYSDLMEHTRELSFYNQPVLGLLYSHPDSVITILDERFALPSLTGIEIHLVYQPANIEADQTFRIVSEFYEKMLEAKGAKVIIEANI